MEALTQDGYRCLTVTLPYFSGKHNLTNSWGVGFQELSNGFASIVEKHSKSKKVTLLIHDWGSVMGYLFARDRPDLVKRICSIDIGGRSS